MTTGSEAFKESVTFIDFRALDPEHELSEEKDTLKDKLENDILITMTKELRRMPYVSFMSKMPKMAYLRHISDISQEYRRRISGICQAHLT